jgi:hypothetical protein
MVEKENDFVFLRALESLSQLIYFDIDSETVWYVGMERVADMLKYTCVKQNASL